MNAIYKNLYINYYFNNYMESNSRYGKLLRNKLSLVMWVVINNNRITQNLYVALMMVDFSFTTLIILCLYSNAGCSPAISPSIISVLDFDVQPTLSMINMVIASTLLGIMAMIMVLIIMKLPRDTYSRKGIAFQMLSFLVTLINQPLFGIACLFTMNTFFSFTSQMNEMNGNSSLMMYIGFVSSVITALWLILYQYFGAHLLNISVPNSSVPWSCTSHRPALYNAFFKMLIMLTYRLRNINPYLMYAAAATTLITCGVRIFVLLFRSHIINARIYSVSILLSCAHFHLLSLLIVTAIQANGSQPHYIFYVIFFMPVTCCIGMYLKMCQKHDTLLYPLSSNESVSKYKILISFLNLTLECQYKSNHQALKQLYRLQSAHDTQCSVIYNQINESILKGSNHEPFLNGFLNTNEDLKEDAVAIASQSEMTVINSKAMKGQYEMGLQSLLQHPKMSAKLNINDIQTPTKLRSLKKRGVNNIQSQKGFSIKTLEEAQCFQEKKQFEEEKKEQSFYNAQNQHKIKERKNLFHFNDDCHTLMSENSNSKNQRSIASQKSMMTQNIYIKDEEHTQLISQSRAKQALKLQSFLDQRTFDDDARWVQLRELVSHLFNYHIPLDMKENLKLKLIKAYFTFQIMNNIYLANFLLFNDLDEDSFQEDLITANFKLIHLRYFEDLFFQRENKLEGTHTMQQRGQLASGSQVDIQNVLRINRTLVEFDNSMATICECIRSFWEDLMTQSETRNIFVKGIGIADQLNIMLILLKQICETQANYETKTFYQMAQFYQLVVAKPSECSEMFEKIRLAQTSKGFIQNMNASQVNGQIGAAGKYSSKCMLIAKIDSKNSMKIEFLNKVGQDLLKYVGHDISNLTINDVMPKFISEQHQAFVDNFMITGKSHVLSTQRELFLKQSTGCLIPVSFYLFINPTNRNRMILFFEQNTQFSVYDAPENDKPFCFILANGKFEYGEISHDFKQVTGISHSEIRHIQKESERKLLVDDFVMIRNYDHDLKILREAYGDHVEAEVSFYNIRHNQDQSLNDSQNSEILVQNNSQLYNQSGVKAMKAREITTDDGKHFFIMKIIDMKLMGGKYELKLLAFRRIPRFGQNGVAAINASEIQIGIDTSVRLALSSTLRKEFRLGMVTDKIQEGQRVSNNNEDIFNGYDMSSQASTGSQQISHKGNRTILDSFSQKISSQNSPKTLKFLINLVLLIVLLMFISSSVVLSLAQSNLTYAYRSIFVSQHSFQSYDETSAIKILWRAIANIQAGYVPNSGTYVIDRFRDYRFLIYIMRRELRDDTNEIVITSAEEGFNLVNTQIIECWALSSNGMPYLLNETLPDGLTMITTKSATVLAEGTQIQNFLSNSQQSILDLESSIGQINPTVNPASQIEQDFFFIINNTNGPLQDLDMMFGPIFVELQLSNIAKKLIYLSGTALSVIILFMISGAIILPLFGRIQNRIMELMKLFFVIDLASKMELIKNIDQFQQQWFSKKQKNHRIQKRDVASRVMDAHSPAYLLKMTERGQKINENEGTHQKLNRVFNISKKTDDQRKSEDSHVEPKDEEKENKIQEDEQNQTVNGIYQKQVSEFNKYIMTRRIWQSSLIIIVLLIMASYFLVMYILSSQYQTLATDSVRDIETTFSRLSCQLTIISHYTESFFQGANLTESRFLAISNQINTCIQAEKFYKENIINENVPYMANVIPYVMAMESGSLCPMLIEQTSTPDNCEAMAKQISQIGMASYLFGFMQSIQQMLIDLQTTKAKGQISVQYISNQLIVLTNYIDTIIEVILPSHINIENLLVQEASLYFQRQQSVVSAIFGSYFSATVIMTLVFFTIVFQRLKKEMVQSNRMLYIIDFDSLSEEQRAAIIKFVSNY